MNFAAYCFFGDNDFYERFFLSTTLSENATSSVAVQVRVACTKYRVQEFKENTFTNQSSSIRVF